jgi:hypothetical protein
MELIVSVLDFANAPKKRFSSEAGFVAAFSQACDRLVANSRLNCMDFFYLHDESASKTLCFINENRAVKHRTYRVIILFHYFLVCHIRRYSKAGIGRCEFNAISEPRGSEKDIGQTKERRV